MRATITIHRPAHRRQALALQTERRAAEAAYDANIDAYLRYLQQAAKCTDFVIADDEREGDTVFSMDDATADTRETAFAWLAQLPDIWNWMPSATGRVQK